MLRSLLGQRPEASREEHDDPEGSDDDAAPMLGANGPEAEHDRECRDTRKKSHEAAPAATGEMRHREAEGHSRRPK